MKLILGHTNMDMDCLGSMVLAKKLFPDHVLVKSRLIHPVAANLYNLYENKLDFLASKELENEQIEELVVVDTRSYSRIKEYFDFIRDFNGPVKVFDHHISDSSDIPGAAVHQEDFGANTTLLTLEIMKNNISLTPDEATIALAGIYADTGNFLHENVKPEDFQAAAFLRESGAVMSLINFFLKTMREEYQITLFHHILNRLIIKKIHGHTIIMSHIRLDRQEKGLAEIVEKVFEVESCDALFVLFSLAKEKKELLIARSRKETVNLHSLLSQLGGGGHPAAASLLLKNGNPEKSSFNLNILERHLKRNLYPAVMAYQLMSAPVSVIRDEWPLLEASLFLEEINHTGAPVVNGTDELCGFMTLRDISKGRRAGMMKAPVKAYMSRVVRYCSPDAPLRDVEQIFLTYNIGHVPVVDNNKVIGIITRSDYLGYQRKTKKAKAVSPI
ncbi:MAG: CBS domain-containing protein [Spirochaetia bacterium]